MKNYSDKISTKTTEFLYGIHPVIEALKAGRRTFHEIYIEETKKNNRFDKIMFLAKSLAIPVTMVSNSFLDKSSGLKLHQGVCAKVTEYESFDILDITQNTQPIFLLILDGIIDPNNLGALIRTGVCAGIDGVIIPKDRSCSPTAAVSKSSSGALEYVKLCIVNNIVRTITELKEKNLWMIGLEAGSKKNIYETDFTGSIGIVIGSEDKGMRPLVKKSCDFLASIPQKGQISSLNASSAGAVALYEAYRQRNFAKI
ncbi:MAG: 23S rRNA (guanosine(2251)-2'-O)-methyltransferase RlmB [Desulfobacterales bacterium]|nr:23S rRNA (guanosine(2251)-2'-O)-methyltransferase RlmB [Desulfobacterales bacterium]